MIEEVHEDLVETPHSATPYWGQRGVRDPVAPLLFSSRFSHYKEKGLPNSTWVHVAGWYHPSIYPTLRGQGSIFCKQRIFSPSFSRRGCFSIFMKWAESGPDSYGPVK
jgi:hypothetical protein